MAHDDISEYNSGLEFLVLNKYEEAESVFTRITKSHPSHFGALCNLGIAIALLGQPTEAEVNFRRAIEVKPNKIHAWFNLGVLLSQRGQTSDASHAFKMSGFESTEFMKHESEDGLWHRIGVLVFLAGNENIKEQLVRKLLEIRPKDPILSKALGSVLMEQNKTFEALEILKIKHESEVAVEEPKEGFLAVFYDEGPYTLSVFKRGCQYYLEHITTPQWMLDFSPRIGVHTFPLYELEKTEAAFQRASEIRPDEPYIWYSLGLIREKRGRYRESAEAYKKALDIVIQNETDGCWFNNPLEEYFQLRGEKLPPAILRKRTTENIKAHLWHYYGFVLGEQQKFEEAIEAYSNAIEMQTKDRSVWRELRTLLIYQDQLDGIVQIFGDMVDIQPDNVFAWYEYGLLLAHQLRYDDALAAFEEAKRLDESQPSIWFRIGILKLYFNDKKEGELALDRAIQLSYSFNEHEIVQLVKPKWRDFLLKDFFENVETRNEFMLALFGEMIQADLRSWICSHCGSEFSGTDSTKIFDLFSQRNPFYFTIEFQCHSCGSYQEYKDTQTMFLVGATIMRFLKSETDEHEKLFSKYLT